MERPALNGHSFNPQAELLAKLLADMPEIFSEGKIDAQKLQTTLGEDVFADQERYGLTWNGKAECFKKIQETTTNTLKPCRDESVDFDGTGHLLIEGDNLQVLKVLQKSYYGKVKMIYIDPPYNTGNDFIYSDKFSRTRREELVANGSMDEHGNIINHDLYRQNTRDSGHFHSNWLNMMYPRLFLARNLLRQDGVIFVSIDDNEAKNLRAMLEEIFGEENFVAQFVWKSRQNKDNRNLTGASIDHEYVLCFGRSQGKLRGASRKMEQYSNPDNDPRGAWNSGNMVGLLPEEQRPNCHYDLIDPETGNNYGKPKLGWRYDRHTMKRLIGEKRILWPEKVTGRPRRKVFLSELEDEFTGYSSVIGHSIYTRQGTRDLEDIFDGTRLVDFPKPVALLKELIVQGNMTDGIVIDFFAGSGTTAHAVMQLNAEDNGKRKWICVQLPEKCKAESEAAKAGFVAISDIAKERIRRTGTKIKGDYPDQQLDVGFKAFKLEESNFKVWNTQVESVEQLEQQLLDFVDNVRPDAGTEDILYELILKTGLELNVPIEEKQAEGGKYHRIGDGALIICLANVLTQPLLDAILQDRPERLIVLDRAFANNDQLKTNMLLEAEHAGVKEFTVI